MLRNASTYSVFKNDMSISLLSANRQDFFSKYKLWTEQLSNIPEFKNATVSISDNIAAPLEFRPDTILIGSFIWSDILPETSENKEVIEIERNLLVKNMPAMLHIDHFGMPALSTYTSPVSIPWVTIKKSISSDVKNNILITSGKSGQDVERFAELAIELASHFPERVFIDNAIAELVGSEKLQRFSFNDSDFGTLGAIVCRPGIGIITEAVTYNIPIVTFNDFNNKELDFNAQMIQDTSIGIVLSKKNTTSEIVDSILSLLNTSDIKP
ncbi:MAG: hypothetical protein KDC92_15320, partial [Bacteroidetes bacterium]|nr:hypothetical protein [Bacteroidota bacterium]